MATAADSRTVSLTMPAKAEYVVLARLALSAVCRLTSLQPDEVADLKLAITEGAALFVGGGTEPGNVTFDFRLDDDRLILGIEGPPQTMADGDGDVDERELGREIIRATADEFEYGDRSVRLVKYVRSAAE